MVIKKVEDKLFWDKFMAAQKGSQFLQSFLWGEFKENLGLEIIRLGVFEKEKMIMAAQLIKNELPLGNYYLYAPRGPVFDGKAGKEKWEKAFLLFQKEAEEIARKSGAAFLRIEPALTKNIFFDFEKFGFKPSFCTQPPDTVMINLSQSEEEILKKMNPKTRYNIGLAGRRGVKISFSREAKEIDPFYDLVEAVSRREKIGCFSKDYYKKMFEVFSREDRAEWAKAEYKGRTLVINLIIYFGDTASYNHGGSSDEHRNVMAPHLTQWESIRRAKARGGRFYDFRGIAPSDDPNHKWAGITRFKKGFGGETTHYPGAYDLAFKPFVYQLYCLGKRIR